MSIRDWVTKAAKKDAGLQRSFLEDGMAVHRREGSRWKTHDAGKEQEAESDLLSESRKTRVLKATRKRRNEPPPQSLEFLV